MGSRSDQRFKKRKAQKAASLARAKATKPFQRRALIVCEGEKTEPLYIEALVSHLGLTTAEVKVCGKSGSAPTNVVEYGIRELQADDDYEFVYFVIDRDCHADYDQAIGRVYGIAKSRKYKSKTIEVISSVPCFEVWFLMHFEAYARPHDKGGGKSPCGNLISSLQEKPGFEDYSKGEGTYFDQLSHIFDEAKRNSLNRLEESIKSGDRKHHGNPTTLMHQLIDGLEDIARDKTKQL